MKAALSTPGGQSPTGLCAGSSGSISQIPSIGWIFVSGIGPVFLITKGSGYGLEGSNGPPGSIVSWGQKLNTAEATPATATIIPAMAAQTFHGVCHHSCRLAGYRFWDRDFGRFCFGFALGTVMLRFLDERSTEPNTMTETNRLRTSFPLTENTAISSFCGASATRYSGTKYVRVLTLLYRN